MILDRVSGSIIYMKYSVLGVFFLFLVVGVSSVAYAQDPPDGILLANPSDLDDVQDLLDSVINFFNLVLGPILVIVILIGAFKMLTAQGNENKYMEGRKTVQYAVIGAVVVLVADGIILIIKEILEVS